MTKITTAEVGTAGTSLASGGNYGGDTVDLISKSATGSITLDATAGRMAHGTKSIRFSTAATNDTAILGLTPTDTPKQIATQFYFSFDALPSVNVSIVQWRSTVGNYTLVLNTVGRVVTSGMGTALSIAPVDPPLAANTVYRFSASLDTGVTGTGDGRFECNIYLGDSTTPLKTLVTTTANLGGGTFNSVRIGKLVSSEATLVGWNYDDFRFTTGQTALLPPEPTQAAPSASAGTSRTTSVGTGVQLAGTASGTGVTYQWSLSSSQGGAAAALTNSSTLTPTVTPSAAGILTYRLLVTDNIGQTASDFATVYVTADTVRPIAVTSNTGGWTTTGAGDAAAAMSDSSSATFAQSPDSPTTTSPVRVRLAPLAPGSGFSMSVTHKLTNAGTGTATATLYEGATVRKSWTLTPDTGLATTVLTLTPSELAAIGSLNTLDVEFAWSV
jgi:hypothetical protein